MANIVVIGGGVIGLSVAYHLAKRDVDDVVLLERNQLSSGTSWHAAGIVGPLRASPNLTTLAMYALELFPVLEKQTGLSTGFKTTSGYWLARETERLDELHRIAALGRHLGLDAHMIDTQTASNTLPCLDLQNHAGALRVAEDANVNPVDLCMAYANAARQAGVEIREGTEVTSLATTTDKRGNRKLSAVILGDGSSIETSTVALCTGAWSKPLAASAGLALPLQAVEHMYVVTEPVADIPDPFPVLRDLDTGIYIKGDAGGRLVIGGFEPDAKCWDAFGPTGNHSFLEMPEDWDQFSPFMDAALELMPALADTGIRRFMNGPESFTNDTRPLVGEAPETDGLFVAAGMNSVGILSSAGVGRLLADWMIDGEPHSDVWEVDVARVDPLAASDTHMHSRMEESVADLFAMHWPFKQPKAGRNLRKSRLHEQWAAQGAVFGLTAGWERGLWYAQSENERDLPYSVGAQPWQSIIEREAATMDEGTVLLDLSPFGKFDVTGPDATQFMQFLTCANIDTAIDQVTYTPVLNQRGGIEADITVTRINTNEYRLTSGAATRWRDKALLRHRSVGFNVTVTDVTESESVIGVMGAGARALLGSITYDNNSDTNWNNFAFSTSRSVNILGHNCRATRLSFVGEAGWELNIPLGAEAKIFDALISAGKNANNNPAKPMGHYALDACRIEKGYYHWGHDLGPEITPLEAGLAFCIDWDKDFVGKAALQEQLASGVSRRLCLFSVTGKPLVLHDEPIFEDDKIVGLTSSGGFGARTGLTLAFGLINIKPGETRAETCQRQFEIDIAGKRYSAKALLKPPFDPDGTRLRA